MFALSVLQKRLGDGPVCFMGKTASRSMLTRSSSRQTSGLLLRRTSERTATQPVQLGAGTARLNGRRKACAVTFCSSKG